MFKRFLSAIILLACLSTAQGNNIERQGNSVTLHIDQPVVNGPKQVRLQVVNDQTIRVEVTCEDAFPVKQSLMIVDQTNTPQFTTEEQSENLVISTSRVKAVVSKITGRVQFYDTTGRLLLSEAKELGKTFKPFTVPEREIGVGTITPEQSKGYTWRTLFDSPKDEAFYGLGQHQANELNMKGKNEDLFQYNTKISVPFVVSNKGYGLLWDTYSYCRWGNPNDYQQLYHTFKLYDKDGNPGALTGTYKQQDGKTIVRSEDSLYYENSEVITNLPTRDGFKLSGSQVVYEGEIEAPTSDDYRFILYYAGYIKLFIDGQEVVGERWRAAWNPSSYKFTYPLTQGRRVPIRIEWRPDGDVSYVSLRAAMPQTDSDQNRLSFWSEMSRDMDYYFIAGDNMDDVIHGYRTLTGKAQVMPRWSMGFWQSRERYKSSDDLLSTLGEFRKRHIPVDNIVQDWNYWPIESWGSHEFEASRYPNPQAMMDSIHQLHGRFMISVWPKFYCTTQHYKELDNNGWIYQQAVKDSIYDWLNYMGSFYDAYSPDARRLFWKQMDNSLYSKYKFGIDAWWMDASEPNVRDCTPMWYRKALSGPTALGSSTEYFNAYALVNADAIYNGQRQVNPNQRVFLLTRSGFAGLQRYSTASWSGDIGTRWEDMRAQMTAGMNYSLSGIPFWGMDIGGFTVENRYSKAQQHFDATGEENADLKEWRELQTRWHQFGCFVPLFRTHGQWPLREVWNIAPESHPAYQSIVYYDKLRYRLMPYLYSMAGWTYFKDYTLMRALVMDFPEDTKVNDIKDQWMFGPSLMACPIGYYGARERQVYLPKSCGWYDFYTGQHMAGGQTITVNAPYERIPVFVPEGAIIPIGPDMEWSDEKPAELIDLYIYAGKDGQFELYEDENTNYNYEKGACSTIRITYNNATKNVTFDNRKGSFPGMLQKRRFNIHFISQTDSKPLDLQYNKGKIVKYNGKVMKVRL